MDDLKELAISMHTIDTISHDHLLKKIVFVYK